MTIAVTGGTGFVGQAVLDEAARRGVAVRALTRREQEVREGVTWVRGGLSDHTALAELVRGADAVMHIAGVVNAPDPAGFQSGNVQGTQAVLDAARGAGVDRFVCVSSIAAREPDLSLYGKSKRQGEELVTNSAFDWTVVRPPAVFGPRDTEIFEVFRAARTYVVPMPPPGRASVIHVGDLARLLLDVMPGGESVSRRIFEPDDGRPNGWSHKELAHAIGRAMGRRVWAPNVPTPLMMLGARLDRLFRGRKAKLSPDRARYMTHPDWVSDPSKAVPPGLWQPEIETLEGLAATAEWYRQNKWL